MTGLLPLQTVYYSFGSAQEGFSREYSFTMPPAVGRDVHTRFLMVADMGTIEPDSTTVYKVESQANLTIRNLKAVEQAHVVMHVGDLS